MKRMFSLWCGLCLFYTPYAQVITANDSVNTETGSNQLIFYNLATTAKTAASDTDWHLMVTVRPTQFPQSPLGGTTIRFNETRGVNVFIAPHANAGSFNNLDTTNWRNWRKLHDSDTSLDLGAFNSTRSSNIFDFGWGFYNSTSHNVIGDSIFLIELPDGELKKFLVVGLIYDTAFNLKYADLANYNVQNLQIRKADYPGKEFVYLNLYNNSINDKEPAGSSWDLEFLQYAASDVSPGSYLPKTGVWLNKGALGVGAAGVDVKNNYYQALNFSNHLNAIGWNWQRYDSLHINHVRDSLAYFVQTATGNYYKIIFTSFGENAPGIIAFYTQALTSQSGIQETGVENIQNLYPNPAGSSINILLNSPSASSLKIFDLTGKLVAEKEIADKLTGINTSQFAEGMYILQVTTEGRTSVAKFAVTR